MHDYHAGLDQFVRCPVSGCEWMILYGVARCFLHRGPAGPQYQVDSDGAIIRTRFMTREHDPAYEPEDAA